MSILTKSQRAKLGFPDALFEPLNIQTPNAFSTPQERKEYRIKLGFRQEMVMVLLAMHYKIDVETYTASSKYADLHREILRKLMCNIFPAMGDASTKKTVGRKREWDIFNKTYLVLSYEIKKKENPKLSNLAIGLELSETDSYFAKTKLICLEQRYDAFKKEMKDVGYYENMVKRLEKTGPKSFFHQLQKMLLKMVESAPQK